MNIPGKTQMMHDNQYLSIHSLINPGTPLPHLKTNNKKQKPNGVILN